MDFNIDQLTEFNRGDKELTALFDKIDELEPSDFGDKFTRKRLCFTSKTNKKKRENLQF